jgi:hypothetical protein
MEYKGFYISTYEREPEKWRARIRRVRDLPVTGRKKFAEYITDNDASTAAQALKMAIADIDSGSFLPRSKKGTERFWRRVQRRTSEHH